MRQPKLQMPSSGFYRLPLTTTPAVHTVAASRGLQRGELGNRGAKHETDPDKLSGCSTGEIAWASNTLVPLST